MSDSETPHVRGPRPHAPRKAVPEAPVSRRWAPWTTAGRWAVGLTIVAAASMLLGLLPGDMQGWDLGGDFAPNLVLPLGFVGGFVGAGASFVALFRRRDRAILVWLAFVFSVLIGLFWIAFMIGEAVFPH